MIEKRAKGREDIVTSTFPHFGLLRTAQKTSVIQPLSKSFRQKEKIKQIKQEINNKY